MPARFSRHWLALASLLLTGSAQAATIHVPGDHATIQAALQAASSGDVVRVAPGVYSEQLVLGAAQNGVELEGSAGSASTILDGGGSGTVLRITQGVGAGTGIRGFTIRNGRSPNPGGGVLIERASPSFVECVIEGNTAPAGGGVYANGASPSFLACILRDNHAPFGSGGGLYADNGGTTSLAHSLVYGNDCAAFGGGLTAWVGSVVVLDHVTVADNAATLSGGNLYFRRGGRFQATASLIALPAAGSNLQAEESPGTSSFQCCDLYVASGVNTDGFPSPLGANQNFSLDPVFCDLGAGQLGLAATSPCAAASNTGGCGQVGARDAECFVVSARKQSWGELKSGYRRPE